MHVPKADNERQVDAAPARGAPAPQKRGQELSAAPKQAIALGTSQENEQANAERHEQQEKVSHLRIPKRDRGAHHELGAKEERCSGV